YEQGIRSRYASPITTNEDEFTPVVYVTLAANTTVKGLNALIANFYALPYNTRDRKVDLTLMLQEVARRCGTTLFLFDDIHYLKLSLQSDREVSDHLKHMASTISATFVLAGIDCEESGFLR